MATLRNAHRNANFGLLRAGDADVDQHHVTAQFGGIREKLYLSGPK